jgi:c-di-GMP-binding flagellar brake protein YcgR
MEERRCEPRWTVNQQAQLQIEDHPNYIPCTVEDISSRGMCISLGKHLFAEAFSNINIILGDALAFNTGAHVAWEEEEEGKNTYGLFFNRIDDLDKEKVTQYINNNFSDKLMEDSRKQWWRGL